MSPSSKGSPHSGQNLGGLVGSAGSQPHLSHLYWGTPAGFFVPHSAQNLPLLDAPQVGQVQAPSADALGGSGFLAPHSGQNLPVATLPQAQVQLSPAGAAGCAGAAGAGCAGALCTGCAACCCPIWNSAWGFIPPAAPAIPMPIKPMVAPPSLAAAACIALAWAPTRCAAARVGSRKAALRCISLIICSSSSDALILDTPRETISMPLRSRHLAERTSLRASASSRVWAGTAE